MKMIKYDYNIVLFVHKYKIKIEVKFVKLK